jgi:hypothetical protein
VSRFIVINLNMDKKREPKTTSILGRRGYKIELWPDTRCSIDCLFVSDNSLSYQLMPCVFYFYASKPGLQLLYYFFSYNLPVVPCLRVFDGRKGFV